MAYSQSDIFDGHLFASRETSPLDTEASHLNFRRTQRMKFYMCHASFASDMKQANFTLCYIHAAHRKMRDDAYVRSIDGALNYVRHTHASFITRVYGIECIKDFTHAST